LEKPSKVQRFQNYRRGELVTGQDNKERRISL
jgi:hypothetical protein